MMISSDPIALGQRLVALLSLVDWSVENLPAEHNAVTEVPIADQVIEYYWPQVAEYAGITGEFHKVLKQGPPQAMGVAIVDQAAFISSQLLIGKTKNRKLDSGIPESSSLDFVRDMRKRLDVMPLAQRASDRWCAR